MAAIGSPIDSGLRGETREEAEELDGELVLSFPPLSFVFWTHTSAPPTFSRSRPLKPFDTNAGPRAGTT